jgi:cell wall-associated NlpC family hydrolase
MRHPRLLLLLLAAVFTIGLALLRPFPGRAAGAVASTGTRTTSTGDPPAPPSFEPGLSRLTTRPRRRLAARRHADQSLLFGRRVVDFARRLIGVPYRYGGTSPGTGFDCSGFVSYVYSHFGLSLPHSSFADLLRGRRVGRRQMHPGDLVFFDGAGHVGIYVGEDRFIHAPHSGTAVRISTMRGWYASRFVEARRLH